MEGAAKIYKNNTKTDFLLICSTHSPIAKVKSNSIKECILKSVTIMNIHT